eukprot:gene3646-6462_t
MGQRQNKEESTLLSDDLYINILSYLNPEDCMNFMLVNKSFQKIAMNDYLWTEFFKRRNLNFIFKKDKFVDYSLYHCYKKKWKGVTQLCSQQKGNISNIIEILVNSNIIEDSKPASVSYFIKNQKGLDPQIVSEILLHKVDKKYVYLSDFYKNFNYNKKFIVDELRIILDKNFIKLPSQTSRAVPFLYEFSDRYYEENVNEYLGFRDDEDVWYLVSSILLLNVSLHSRKLKSSERITKIQYRGMLTDCKFEDSYIDSVYDNVKNKEI